MTETRAEAVVEQLWELYAEVSSPFPTENIGVDPEQDTSIAESESQETYWRETYGGRGGFDCLVRTILSQNTSDVASQPAYEALLERYGPRDPTVDDRASKANVGDRSADRDGDHGAADLAEALAAADRDELAATISPAGLHNQKSRVIQTVAATVLAAYGSEAAFDEFVASGEYDAVREALLAFDGVGLKTADCVLLFAGGCDGVFPVDTHVHRIYRRLGIAPPDADHEAVRAVLESQVPGPKCGFGHTASIQFGREFCTARTPACLDGPEACPLYEHCDRVGVDLESETVVDPAEAASGVR